VRREFYKMDFEEWDESTDELPLELEGALLNASHHTLRMGRTFSAHPETLARLWRCNPAKASRILSALVSAGKVSVDEVGRLIEPRALFILQAGSTFLVNARKSLPAEIRQLIIDRDDNTCVYCGEVSGEMHIDHIVPVSRGGSDDPDNLCVACRSCNLSKGAKLLEEWN
jgi:hypothetical protein